MGEDVLGSDREHDLDLVGEPLRVLPSIGVDPSRKGVQVGAEVRALRRVPLAGPARGAHGSQPPIRLQEALPPVLGRPSPGLPVEAQEQVAVAVHLRPAEGVEEADVVVSEDVRHTPGVPEQLGASRDQGSPPA